MAATANGAPRPSPVRRAARLLPAGLRRRIATLPRAIGYERGPRVMSALRKRWVLLRHPHATIRFGEGVYLGPGFSLHIPGPGTFVAGPRVEFRRNFRCEISGSGRVSIGADTHVTYDVVIACTTSVEIGERCSIAYNTSVYDGNHRYRDLTVPFLEQGYRFKDIHIADDVLIHGLCTILDDVGERAVIGAHAVVTRPVPAFTLAAGAPARVVDYFGPAGQEPEGFRPD